MKKALISLIIIAGLCQIIVFAKTRITQVANVSLLGGQYFLDDDSSSFGGNASIYYCPVLNFTRKRALVPVFNIDYSGTKNVQDLVGGGTLTSQTADAGVTLKYVEVIGGGKYKLRLGYKKSLINETKNEKWTKGLFDYNRLLYGIEAQRVIAGYSVSLAGDYYNVSFPNYSSLIYKEEYQTSIDTQTYAEISSNAGEDVLDYSDIGVSFEVSKKFSQNFSAYCSYRMDIRPYKDQTIVQSDGSFSADKREDTVNTISTGLEYVVKRTGVILQNKTRFNRSSQNSYDANVTKFSEDFYSYNSSEFSPKLSFYLGSGKRLSRLRFWWVIELKKYIKRQAQDKNANYLNDRVNMTDNGFGVSYDYPLMEKFFITCQLNRRTISSNMKYEGNYKYNYTVSNYYVGLNWQYGKSN